MSLIVQKFGGTSVKDAERIFHVAGIIADAYRAGNDVIVVLSAQGDTTDDLVAKAQEIDPHASRREMDMLLSQMLSFFSAVSSSFFSFKNVELRTKLLITRMAITSTATAGTTIFAYFAIFF